MKTLLVPYRHGVQLAALASAFAADDAVVVSPGPAGAVVARLHELTAQRVASSDEPVTVVSGDGTTALATMAGLQRRGLIPAVIWLSARGDFHTPHTTGSGDLDGMVLAMLVGRAGPSLARALALVPVAEHACALVGARGLDRAESDALDASAVLRVALAQLATAPLPPAPWYVHVDAAAIDPADAPPLRFPVPAGPSFDAVAGALQALSARGTIAALGIACTLTPMGLAAAETPAWIRRLAGAVFGPHRTSAQPTGARDGS